MKKSDERELLLACRHIIEDFLNFGPVMQVDMRGGYGETSSIGRLMRAVERIEGGKAQRRHKSCTRKTTYA